MFLPFILSILEFKFVNHSCHGPIFCSKNPDNYFAYCLGRFLLNLFSFVILIKYADILFMNTDTLIHVIEKKAYLICIHEKNTCILTILNDMPGKKVKQLAKKFDCD